jgi:RNA polymerase sigma-70 factor, ECF subfamily
MAQSSPMIVTALPDDADEASLVAALRAGEDAAFEALVRDYGGRLMSVARRMLNSEDDACDAVQEAFITAFRSINRFEEKSQLATWLHRIVVNASLMRLRGQRRKREQPIEDLLPTFIEDGHQSHPTPRWDESALTKLERSETQAQVRASIAELPETYREVLLLRDIEELDTDTVAELLGITPGAVKVRLHRARQALKTLLESVFGERAVDGIVA